MAAALTPRAIQDLLDRLPREQDAYDDIRRRVRLTTHGGRSFFAFVRAGVGGLSFAGWEDDPARKAEDDWEYFVLGAEKPGDPLQLISRDGPLGVVVAVELEESGGRGGEGGR